LLEVEREGRTRRTRIVDKDNVACSFAGGFSRHGERCPMVEKESLAGNPARRMRHRHTVDLDIPRQVAPLQSLTPLLQAKQA